VDLESFLLLIGPAMPSTIMFTLVLVQDWRERKAKQP
jgi:hypothetical protein